MKALKSAILASLLMIPFSLAGQVNNPQIVLVSAPPSGACSVNLPDRQVVITGALYTCQSGTWATVGGGGGGGGNLSGTLTTNAVSYGLGVHTEGSIPASVVDPATGQTTLNGLIGKTATTGGSFSSVTFTGSGLNDFALGGSPTCGGSLGYSISVSSSGTPDQFTLNIQGVLISGSFSTSPQTLPCGIVATFGATTGHTPGDEWDFTSDLEQSYAPIQIKNADGSFSLQQNVDGSQNGQFAVIEGPSGAYNTGIGLGALSNTINGGGQNNVALGSVALLQNTSGIGNSAVGFGALQNNTTGQDNEAFGLLSLGQTTTGNFNVAYGSGALGANISGNANIALGPDALAGGPPGTGSFNIGIGYQSQDNLTTGSNNISIGRASLISPGSENNNLAIDNDYTNQDHPLLSGDFSTSTFGVNGQLNITKITPGTVEVGQGGTNIISGQSISVTGTFTGGTTTNYCLMIDGIGTPDTFSWGTGGSCTSGATHVAITGSAQLIGTGLSATFSQTTGDFVNDQFFFTGYAAMPTLKTNGGVQFTGLSTATQDDVLGIDSSGNVTKQAAGGGGPLVSPYTFVAETTGTTVTTPAISVTAGQLLIVSCRFGVGSTCVSTDSASDTFTAITAQNIGGVGTGIKMSYAIAGTTGSTTFTCTQGSSGGGLSCIALPISGITGSSPNTNTGGTTTTPTTVVGNFEGTTNFSFTTTARTIDIFCGAVDSGAGYFQSAALGGNSGWIVAQASAGLSTNADQACETQIVPYALPGGTAAMIYGASVESAYSVIAWPY